MYKKKLILCKESGWLLQGHYIPTSYILQSQVWKINSGHRLGCGMPFLIRSSLILFFTFFYSIILLPKKRMENMVSISIFTIGAMT